MVAPGWVCCRSYEHTDSLSTQCEHPTQDLLGTHTHVFWSHSIFFFLCCWLWVIIHLFIHSYSFQGYLENQPLSWIIYLSPQHILPSYSMPVELGEIIFLHQCELYSEVFDNSKGISTKYLLTRTADCWGMIYSSLHHRRHFCHSAFLFWTRHQKVGQSLDEISSENMR